MVLNLGLRVEGHVCSGDAVQSPRNCHVEGNADLIGVLAVTLLSSLWQ